MSLILFCHSRNYNQYDNDDNDDDNSNNIIINKQLFISELTKYRNIKLVIKSLKQKQIQITNNIKELENQKTVLRILRKPYLHVNF